MLPARSPSRERTGLRALRQQFAEPRTRAGNSEAPCGKLFRHDRGGTGGRPCIAKRDPEEHPEAAFSRRLQHWRECRESRRPIAHACSPALDTSLCGGCGRSARRHQVRTVSDREFNAGVPPMKSEAKLRVYDILARAFTQEGVGTCF